MLPSNSKAASFMPGCIRQMLRAGDVEGVPPEESGTRGWRIPAHMVATSDWRVMVSARYITAGYRKAIAPLVPHSYGQTNFREFHFPRTWVNRVFLRATTPQSL